MNGRQRRGQVALSGSGSRRRGRQIQAQVESRGGERELPTGLEALLVRIEGHCVLRRLCQFCCSFVVDRSVRVRFIQVDGVRRGDEGMACREGGSILGIAWLLLSTRIIAINEHLHLNV